MKTALTTPRLALVMLSERHAKLALDFVVRNREFLKEWEPKREPAYFTRPYQAKLLDDEAWNMEAGWMFKVWLRRKEERDRVIGSVSLNNIIRGCFQSCHLGYRLDEKECNKGYMTEAVKAIVDHAFGSLKLHRIEANIMPRNSASLRVAEKLGFEEEGLGRNYLKINGKWEDHRHMVLLNHAMEEDGPA